MNNMNLRITGGSVAASIALVGILGLGGCAAPNDQTDAATAASPPVVEGPDTWDFVLVGRGTEAAIDLATGSNAEELHPIEPDNEQLVRTASAKVQDYIERAWVKAAEPRVGAPDGIAWDWIPLLGNGADTRYWVDGPTSTDYPTTAESQAAAWRGDLRAVLWTYSADQSSRWRTNLVVDYVKPAVYSGVSPAQVDERNWAIVRRAADGRAKSVLVRWAVEIGLTHTTSGTRMVELVGGFARLEPTGDGGELAIVDPAIRVAPEEMPKMSTGGYVRWREVAPGEPYGEATPYYVGDDWFIER